MFVLLFEICNLNIVWDLEIVNWDLNRGLNRKFLCGYFTIFYSSFFQSSIFRIC